MCRRALSFKVSYYYDPDKRLVGFRPVHWMTVEGNDVTRSSLAEKKNSERAIVLQTMDRQRQTDRLSVCLSVYHVTAGTNTAGSTRPVQKLIKVITDVGCQ